MISCQIFTYWSSFNKKFTNLSHSQSVKTKQLLHSYSLDTLSVMIPILENAENAQARQHVQQQLLLRFSREHFRRVYSPYDAPLTRFSNSALTVPLFSLSSLFFFRSKLFVFFPTKVSSRLSRLVEHAASNLSVCVSASSYNLEISWIQQNYLIF